MSELTTFEVEANFIQLLVITVLIGINLVKERGDRSYERFLFMGGLWCYFLMDCYACACSVFIEKTIYDFSPQDIAAFGAIMLWTSLNRIRRQKFAKLRWLTYGTIAFLFFNMILWDLWNGNYITNFVWFIVLTPYLYTVTAEWNPEISRVRSMIYAGLMILVVTGELVNVYADSLFLSIFCYILWALLLFMTALIVHRRTQRSIAAASTLHIIAYLTQSASAGLMYAVNMTFITLTIVYVAWSYKKERHAETQNS